jgi:hypothetical protein
VANYFFPLTLQPQFGPPTTSMEFSVQHGLLDLRHTVGFLRQVISSSQGLYLYTNTEKRAHTPNIYVLSGIRIHDPGFRASEDSACLRPSPSQGLYLNTGQHKHRINAHTDIHALSEIRIHDPSVRASEDNPYLRPRGHRDRLLHNNTMSIYRNILL